MLPAGAVFSEQIFIDWKFRPGMVTDRQMQISLRYLNGDLVS